MILAIMWTSVAWLFLTALLLRRQREAIHCIVRHAVICEPGITDRKRRHIIGYVEGTPPEGVDL